MMKVSGSVYLSAVMCSGLVLSGCRSSGPMTVSSSADFNRLSVLEDKVCSGISNSYQCSRAMEKTQLSAVKGAVSREGARLRIKTSTGSVVELRDSGVEGTDTQLTYQFAGFMPAIRQDLVHVQYFEGDAYLLVDPVTARQTRLDAMPVSSPDKTRIATASMDLEAQYNANRVRVLKAMDGDWQMEYSTEPKSWGPSQPPVWLDNNTLRLVRCLKPCSGESHQTVPALLRRTPEGWVLTDEKRP